MKRLLVLLGLAALYCWLRDKHDPKRQFIGGHRCSSCGCPCDLGYVNPGRRTGPRQERRKVA